MKKIKIELDLTDEDLKFLILALKYEMLFESYKVYALKILNQILKQIKNDNEEVNNSRNEG